MTQNQDNNQFQKAIPNPNQNTPQIETNKIIIHELIKIHKELKKFNSLRLRFLIGITSGFGYVVGASVVVSLVLLILTKLAEIGVLRPWIEAFFGLIGK